MYFYFSITVYIISRPVGLEICTTHFTSYQYILLYKRNNLLFTNTCLFSIEKGNETTRPVFSTVCKFWGCEQQFTHSGKSGSKDHQQNWCFWSHVLNCLLMHQHCFDLFFFIEFVLMIKSDFFENSNALKGTSEPLKINLLGMFLTTSASNSCNTFLFRHFLKPKKIAVIVIS